MRYIESDYIKSETLGEAIFDIKGHIEYNSYSIFKIDYILPLKKTPYMDNIIEFNKKKITTTEGLGFYFVLDPFLHNLVSDSGYLKYFASFKYAFRKKMFFTFAESLNDFFYISKDSFYNFSSHNIVNGQHIEPNTDMTWKTEIVEQDFTIKILDTSYKVFSSFNGKLKKVSIVPVQIRLGYFTCHYIQPSAGIFTYNSYPTIFDADLYASGLIVQIVSNNEVESGFHIDWNIKMSGCKIKSAAFDLYKEEFNSNIWGHYNSLSFNSWYNFKFGNNCIMKIGCFVEQNNFEILTEDDGSRNEEEENNDICIWRISQLPIDLYVRFGYRF